jgi:hypothetical protein
MPKSANAVTTYLPADLHDDFINLIVPHHGLSKAGVLETLVRDESLRIKGDNTKGKALARIANRLDVIDFRFEAIERRMKLVTTLVWALALRDNPTGRLELKPEQVKALADFGDWITAQNE